MSREELFDLEVEMGEEHEDFVDLRIRSGNSFYLENKEMIEALERYTRGSNHIEIPSRKTNPIEIPRHNDIMEIDAFTNPRLSA